MAKTYPKKSQWEDKAIVAICSNDERVTPYGASKKGGGGGDESFRLIRSLSRIMKGNDVKNEKDEMNDQRESGKDNYSMRKEDGSMEMPFNGACGAPTLVGAKGERRKKGSLNDE
nr:uncharacterized protein I203_03883 [Kwoniella mangroviensis CBS 8507]OCF67196.1 hypothetical protein I203_03883 [Kwoniella mangroviensis CBS 8507]